MSRDSGGTYTLPLSPVVTGNVIEATWANTTLNDLATAMTDSLSRSGDGSMQSALNIIDGTRTIPSLSFSSETTSGLYRDSAGDVRISVQNTDIMRWTVANRAQVWDGAWQDAYYGSSGTVDGQLATWDGTNNRWEHRTDAVIDSDGNFWLG